MTKNWLEILIDKFNIDGKRELCSYLLDLNAITWKEFSVKPGNLNFFDGVLTFITLPIDFHQSIHEFFKQYPKKGDFDEKKWQLIHLDICSTLEADYWSEISLSKEETSYFKGLENIVESVRHRNEENLSYAIQHLFVACSSTDKVKFQIFMESKIDHNRTFGNIAPDVN